MGEDGAGGGRGGSPCLDGKLSKSKKVTDSYSKYFNGDEILGETFRQTFEGFKRIIIQN